MKELQEKIGQAEQFQEQRAQVQFHVIFVLFSILTDFAIPFMVFAGPMYDMGTKKFRDKARVGMTTN